jgi:hypothetical protein
MRLRFGIEHSTLLEAQWNFQQVNQQTLLLHDVTLRVPLACNADRRSQHGFQKSLICRRRCRRQNGGIALWHPNDIGNASVQSIGGGAVFL